MQPTVKNVTLTYYLITLLSTLAASFIWGINTLFLLDAGLSNTAAFTANAFYTAGQMFFEIPTGVIADTRGRQTSFLLAAATLLVSTLLYYVLWKIHGPLWAWAIASAMLGLGFAFYSGATQAWLVDALDFTGYKGSLESVFAKGQVIFGIAMLLGTVGGAALAQYTNLGAPYLLRAVMLISSLVIGVTMMRDWGFTPRRDLSVAAHVKSVFVASIDNGWRKPSIRMLMLSAPFTGIMYYVFYAMQPHLLQLYGDSSAYGIAGLAAGLSAVAQIIGSLLVSRFRLFFRTRTAILILVVLGGAISVGLVGFIQNFYVAIALFMLLGLFFAAGTPVRQAYLNGLIKSDQRATVLSFDALFDNAGSAVSQPALGRVADVHGYPASFLISSVIQLGALPFLILARKKKAASDPIEDHAATV